MGLTKFDKIKGSLEGAARGLHVDEFQSVLRRDTARAYSFYQDEHREEELPERGLERYLAIGKALFFSFLRKLTPGRRVAYIGALAAFVWAFWESQWWVAALAFLTLNFLLALELAEKLLTKDELEIARAIQFSLQPDANPRMPELDIASHYQPALDVGGDYYDFAAQGASRFTVILGDVSGKGMPAALYAMKLQALFELLGRSALSPKQMLVEMNEVLSERIGKNYFITAVIGVLDFTDHGLRLARAGHNHPLLYSAATQKTRWLKPAGLGIGMRRSPDFDGFLEETNVPFAAGDVLLFYTDGITEAMNAENEEFGYHRLEANLVANAHLPASEIKKSLLESLERFRQDVPFADDVTLVVAKILDEPKREPPLAVPPSLPAPPSH